MKYNTKQRKCKWRYHEMAIVLCKIDSQDFRHTYSEKKHSIENRLPLLVQRGSFMCKDVFFENFFVFI